MKSVSDIEIWVSRSWDINKTWRSQDFWLGGGSCQLLWLNLLIPRPDMGKKTSAWNLVSFLSIFPLFSVHFWGPLSKYSQRVWGILSSTSEARLTNNNYRQDMTFVSSRPSFQFPVFSDPQYIWDWTVANWKLGRDNTRQFCLVRVGGVNKL